ncbi:MAG: transcription termination factor Rho [Desulfatitalea sp. BRH_c12]|nr:MAG: transcription termination factor Rho [Desulfatitalea sp. BRH_c12]
MKSVKGHLEILDKGYGFLRSIDNNLQPGLEDTFVSAALISEYDLREGVLIEGDAVQGKAKNANLKLQSLRAIDHQPLEKFAAVVPLQSQTSINPDQRLILTRSKDDTMGKALDKIVPIGRGQRGLIIAPPKTGKTTILRHMANAIAGNHTDATVFILLVDERPEEVTDFKRGVQGAHVLSSSADQSIAQHMRMTRLAMNTAIRNAEAGRDAVVFIDSLTRMARAFNTETQSYGRTMSGGLAANALDIPRQLFGAARNLENGGSLTIIATILIDTGSRMDDIIYQEFKGTGNMDLVLNRKCAEHRLWPAIDIKQSGTRKEELLLDGAEYREVIQLRRGLAKLDTVSAMGALLEYLKQ